MIKIRLAATFALVGCALAAGAASATSLPVTSEGAYAASIGSDACTSQVLQGSVPLLNTLRISDLPAACAGRKLVVYTLGLIPASSPAYSGTVGSGSVSFSISGTVASALSGVSVTIDGWPVKVNWLGSLI